MRSTRDLLSPDEAVVVKRRVLAGFRGLAAEENRDARALVRTLWAPEARYFGPHPINDQIGPDAIAETVWRPIREAFRHLRRADDLFFSGQFQGNDWIGATGYLHGVFARDYLGISATENWASLRFGEFHQVEDGLIVRSHVIFDLPDLMRQAGVAPWRQGLGRETLMPGPATRDGIVLTPQDPAESRASLELVEAMIFEGLLQYDGQDSAAMHMERYWTEDMMWYGPGLIGATMGLDGFMRFHQEPWQAAMLPRGPMPTRENKHVTRFAEGKFCGFTGWPSIYATQGGPFLGLPATDLPVEIRVMDFYHRQGERLSENWIFIDMPHLFLQLGIDLFARMREQAASRRS